MADHRLLYCFVSHANAISSDIERISVMCKKVGIIDYIIFTGNLTQDIDHPHLINLSCDDSYEGLSTKVYSMFNYLSKNNSQYQYYAKLDNHTCITKPIPIQVLSGDYCGYAVKIKDGFDGNRTWHFNKCTPNSDWNNKKYSGEFVPWCRGAIYFLSNKAINIISKHPPDPLFHIYEDQYVAEKLLKYGSIKPNHMFDIKQYFYDLDSEF